MPIVTVFGPRQAGKTTLVRKVFPDYSYANLENPTVRLLAERDPEAFFRRYPLPMIIDEVQRVPDLLSHVQVRSDESGRAGEYILTGSHQPVLRERVSQSLAGRTAVLTLWPLSYAELRTAGIELSAEECIIKGFLPRVHASQIRVTNLLEDYYRTYVERDVRQILEVQNQLAFESFVRLLAGRIGQLINFESISNDVGVSAVTLKKWLSVLEASYIVFRLPPYYTNFGKRVVKSPKVFFTDVGLAAHLVGLTDAKRLEVDPLFGGLFENFVVAEAMKWKLNGGRSEGLYFFRDSNGVEVDLILEQARRLHLVEIKGAMTPKDVLATNLKRLGKIMPTASSTVIYRGEDFPIAHGGEFVNYNRLTERLAAVTGSFS